MASKQIIPADRDRSVALKADVLRYIIITVVGGS